MIDRICISINNRCNLSCQYCHFRAKELKEETEMDVFAILDNVKEYAGDHFKIGFVGNGESFLDWPRLKEYIAYIGECKNIEIYTITNGTIALKDEEYKFLEDYRVNVGFSIDGYKELHDKYRCGTFDRAMENVEKYKDITGHYPTFNATVGPESIENKERLIAFFSKFGTRVTFSRMIGHMGITLQEYKDFIENVGDRIPVRRGGLDCTMYGGQCGAGANNFFFSNGKVFYCGNCMDLPPIGDSNMSFYDLERISLDFNRKFCYKESL